MPVLARLGATAALASAIGGFLLSSHRGLPVETFIVPVGPASTEIMQLMRDEHGLVANMIKAQIATENRDQASFGYASHRDRPATVTEPLRASIAR